MDHANKQLLAWIEARLPALVGMDDTSDLATYLATFTTLPEVIEFLEPFAGNTRSMRQFAAEYVERKKAADKTAATLKPMATKDASGDDNDYSAVERGRGKRGKRQGKGGGRSRTPPAAPAAAWGEPVKPGSSADAGKGGGGAAGKQVHTGGGDVGWGDPLKPGKGKRGRHGHGDGGRAHGADRSAAPSKPSAADVARKVKQHTARPARVAGSLCSCQGTVHGVLTNCLNCGKIICKLEAGKTCTFCTLPLENVGPMSKKAIAINRDEALKADDAFAQAHGGATFDQLEEEKESARQSRERALAHKNKLLMFDRTAAARTQVYDDQADYFADTSSSWLSKAERDRAARAEKSRRQDMHARRTGAVTIDLVGRRVINVEESELKDPSEGDQGVELDPLGDGLTSCAGTVSNDFLSGRAAEIYRSIAEEFDRNRAARSRRAHGGARGKGILGNARIQHVDELEMAPPEHEPVTSLGSDPVTGPAASTGPRVGPPSAGDDFWDFAGPADAGALPGLLPSYGEGSSAQADQGRAGGSEEGSGVVAQDAGQAGSPQACLCVDQPMASLVVAGVRRFIGLPWRTQHRGRLWIVATDTIPSQGQTMAAESFYTQMFTGVNVPLPSSYPAHALVGCVDVVGVLSQDEYRSLVLDATSPLENHAPWLWQCENPQILDASAGLNLKRTFDMNTSQLVHLPASFVRGAEKHVTPVPVAWRPVQPLAPVFLRRLSSTGGGGASVTDIFPEAKAVPGADTVITHKVFEGVVCRTQKIKSGMVLLKRFLPEPVQARLLAIARKLGKEAGGFYLPTYDNGSHLHCKMMCLGRHWNPLKGAYEDRRTNFDDATPPLIPAEFLTCVRHAMAEAVRTDVMCAGYEEGHRRGQRTTMASRPSIADARPFNPDIALCNYYTGAGKMGLHQDKHESRASLDAGCPVVSFSIGDSATFAYAKRRPKPSDPEHSVRLDSGDVLVFGGPSRMVFHGVNKVHPHTAPAALSAFSGRLNITFRQSQMPDEALGEHK